MAESSSNRECDSSQLESLESELRRLRTEIRQVRETMWMLGLNAIAILVVVVREILGQQDFVRAFLNSVLAIVVISLLYRTAKWWIFGWFRDEARLPDSERMDLSKVLSLTKLSRRA